MAATDNDIDSYLDEIVAHAPALTAEQVERLGDIVTSARAPRGRVTPTGVAFEPLAAILRPHTTGLAE